MFFFRFLRNETVLFSVRPAGSGKLRARRALKVHERRARDAPCPRATERHLARQLSCDMVMVPVGLFGITLKPETLKTWALGLHICSRLEQDIISLVGKEQDISPEAHKEEMKTRIALDGPDRRNIEDKLKLCIDLLDSTSHPPTRVNLVSGQVAHDTVNVQDTVEIGTKQMQESEKG